VHEETRLDRSQLTMPMTGEQHAPKLFCRMHGVGLVGRLYAHPANDRICGAVENVDERVHHPVKYVERQRCSKRYGLGLADRHRLGRLLAQHDMEVRDERECDREGDAVTTCGSSMPAMSSAGASSRANAGSPIQPNPSEAAVIPSWQPKGRRRDCCVW
jgi:hypothetical protein